MATPPPPTGQPVPVPPAPQTPATPEKPVDKPEFTIAWTQTFDADRRVTIWAGASVVLVTPVPTVTTDPAVASDATASPAPTVPTGAAIIAHRAADGTVAWQSALSTHRPIVFGDGLAFVSHARHVSALAEETGAERWRIDLPAAPLHIASFVGGLLVTTTTELLAYRVVDGQLVWRAALDAPPASPGAASAVAVFVATSDNVLHGFDRVTGRALWRQPIVSAPAALVVHGSRVYYGTSRGTICAFEADAGREAWCYELGATLVGTPLVDDARVCAVLLNNTVYGLAAGGGNLRWRRSIDARPASPAGRIGARVMVPMSDGGLAAIDPDTGRARAALGPPPASPTDATPGRVTLEAGAFASDGSRFFRLTSSSVSGYSLTAIVPAPAVTDGSDRRY